MGLVTGSGAGSPGCCSSKSLTKNNSGVEIGGGMQKASNNTKANNKEHPGFKKRLITSTLGKYFATLAVIFLQ